MKSEDSKRENDNPSRYVCGNYIILSNLEN